MESHIAGCTHCARRLKEYRHFSIKPVEDMAPHESMGLARERIWQKLEQRAGMTGNDYHPLRAWPQVPGDAIWRRRLSIPVPAAAAIVLMVALAFLVLFRMTGTAEASDMTLASETEFDAPGIIPIADMEDVLQYLGSRDNGELIILRLPESRSFVNYGEPAIIKAADYSRTMSGRAVQGGRKH
jgi:hypothetical protein